MDYFEAEDLLDYILIDHIRGWAYLYQLGNREYVVRRAGCGYFFWNVDDWLRFRQEEENASIVKMRRSYRQDVHRNVENTV